MEKEEQHWARPILKYRVSWKFDGYLDSDDSKSVAMIKSFDHAKRLNNGKQFILI